MPTYSPYGWSWTDGQTISGLDNNLLFVSRHPEKDEAEFEDVSTSSGDLFECKHQQFSVFSMDRVHHRHHLYNSGMRMRMKMT